MLNLVVPVLTQEPNFKIFLSNHLWSYSYLTLGNFWDTLWISRIFCRFKIKLIAERLSFIFLSLWSKQIIYYILEFSYCSSPLPLVSMLRYGRNFHSRIQGKGGGGGEDDFASKNSFWPNYFQTAQKNHSNGITPV